MARPSSKPGQGGSSWFHFTYHGDGALHVRARLPGVLAPALESEGFDKLLFAEAGGQVLFQSGRHDIDVRTLPGILDKKPEEVQKLRLGESSRLLDVEIAGEPYKLFLQPCGNLRQGKGPSGWILGGLVRADRLRAAALQVSPIWVIVFASFVLLSALAWPFLRLIAMTPGERLRSIDGLLLALCALTGLATLTILLFDGLVYLGLSHIAERQVEALAVGVRDRLEHEVDAALLRLAAVHGQALATAAAAAPPAPAPLPTPSTSSGPTRTAVRCSSGSRRNAPPREATSRSGGSSPILPPAGCGRGASAGGCSALPWSRSGRQKPRRW